jgi:ribonuclease J
MNVNLYGTEGKWLMVDLGMTFSGNEYPGAELVFADLAFIEERREDLLGIVLTHAHEDHIGAVPYFAADLDVPLYATPFTAKLVAEKLAEAGLSRDVELNVIDHLDQFNLGPFGIRYVPLAHSIAEGNALVIETPQGRIFHTGDWKLDDEPLIGTPATPRELTEIGDEGVLALVCDSTNVFNPNPSGSEGAVARAMRARWRATRASAWSSPPLPAMWRGCKHWAKWPPPPGAACAWWAARSTGSSARRKGAAIWAACPIWWMWIPMALPRGQVLIVATGGQGEPRAPWPASPMATIR